MKLPELHDALNRTAIDARYQPIVRFTDRHPHALEVLARLDHPVRGTLSPQQFVPQIEDAGLAARLTQLVTERAFDDYRAHIGALPLVLSLNFPLDVILVPKALDRLERQRERAGLAPDRIAIELTESRPVTDFPSLARAVDELRRRGYHVAIDDVGPGLPNLHQLMALSFSSVKLDIAVVRNARDPKMQPILHAVIATAKRRGMSVIAEGIEDASTWHSMCALGVNSAQGFLIAQPMLASEVPEWFSTWISTPALT